MRLVDLQFSDIAGGARVMTIPGDLLPAVLRHGYRFDGSAVTGGQREVELDLYLVPDPATLVTYLEPSGVGRRARFTCSVRRRDGQPFAGDPRSVLERNLAEASAIGFDYRVAIELEYYLFQPDNAGLLPPPDAAGYFGTGPGLGTAPATTWSPRWRRWAFGSVAPTTKPDPVRKSSISCRRMRCGWRTPC